MSGQITKKEVVKELIKCGQDPIYFINAYARIQHPTKGLVPFKTFKYQEDVIQAYLNNRFNIILKARQLGITTITAAYIAWFVIFNRDKNVLCVSTKQSTAKGFIRTIRTICKYLPRWLIDFAKISVDNKFSIELDNGSRVTAATTSEDVGRSEAVSFLVVDEVAHIKNFDAIWTGLGPTVTAGGSVALFSSPKGTANFFHKTFVQAQNGENNFNCRLGKYDNPYCPGEFFDDRLPWWVHPHHDLDWFDAETAGMDPRKIAQEYLCFGGETKIATEKGFKCIKDVNVGDKVLTHKGRFKSVINKRSRISDNVYSLATVSNRMPTFITGEHPILTESEEWKPVEELSNESLVCNFPTNIEVSKDHKILDLHKLVEGTFFNILLDDSGENIFVNDRKYKTKIKRFIEVDYDLGFFVGLFLAAGHKSVGGNSLMFAFNRETELNTWVAKIQNILKEKFGLEDTKIFDSNSKCSSFQVNSQIITKFIYLLVGGKDCYSKHLTDFSYVSGNLDYFKGIINGLFLGDGCIKRQYDKIFSSRSSNLIYDLKYLLTICDIGDVRLRKQVHPKTEIIEGRTVNLSDSYVVKLARTINQYNEKVTDLCLNEETKFYAYRNKIKRNDKYVITSLINKEKVQSEMEVFNIEVEEDSSYVTEHFVVHNCDFVASGDTFIYHETITDLENKVIRPEKTFDADRNVWIWEEPVQNATYLIGADVSRGDAQDYSAFHVIRLDSMPLMQVAEYKGKMKPDKLGMLLVDVSKYYNNAYIAPEYNSGWSGPVIMKIQEAGHPFLYYSRKKTQKTRSASGQLVDPYYAQDRNEFYPGYCITPTNRTEMLAKLEQYLRLGEIRICSSRFVAEVKTFVVTDTNKPIAQRGMSDDLIMSMAGTLWVRDEAFLKVYRTDEMTKAIIDGMSISTRDTSAIDAFNYTKDPNNRTRIRDFDVRENKLIMADGSIEDISWLLPRKG